MESQPQNTEFRNNPENFHLCISNNICKSVLLSNNKGVDQTVQLHSLI